MYEKEPTAKLYKFSTEGKESPRIENGKLVGRGLSEDVEIELEEGTKLIPSYATSAGEDLVIEVYKE